MISIREMTKKDTEEVLQMMRVFYNSPAVLSNGSEEIFQNDIENCIGDCPFLEGYIFEDMGEEKGETAGYAMVAKSFSTEFGKPCIWIEDLYMKEKYRGKGIGTKFFSFLEKKYQNTVMRLEVEEDNHTAVHTYEKNGYEVLPYMEMKKLV